MQDMSLLCSSSSPPSLYFYCSKEQKKFCDYLAQVGKASLCNEDFDTYLFRYYYGKDEQYSDDEMFEDKCAPLVGYNKFWENFVLAWKTFVDPKSKMKIPNHYQLSHKCDQCNTPLEINLDKYVTPKNLSILRSELFEDEWNDCFYLGCNAKNA
jgi:hypothetical protein